MGVQGQRIALVVKGLEKRSSLTVVEKMENKRWNT